jgi:hypothetical protein
VCLFGGDCNEADLQESTQLRPVGSAMDVGENNVLGAKIVVLRRQDLFNLDNKLGGGVNVTAVIDD